MGVLGLLNNFLQSPKSDKGNLTNAPLVTLAWTWLVVRYTVPDSDVANVCVFLMTLFAVIVWKMKPSNTLSMIFLVLGVRHNPLTFFDSISYVHPSQFLLQELAHHYYGEVTYMASYAALTPSAALTFLLHNLWLLPFEVRAAITAASAGYLPASSM